MRMQLTWLQEPTFVVGTGNCRKPVPGSAGYLRVEFLVKNPAPFTSRSPWMRTSALLYVTHPSTDRQRSGLTQMISRIRLTPHSHGVGKKYNFMVSYLIGKLRDLIWIPKISTAVLESRFPYVKNIFKLVAVQNTSN